MANQDNAHTGSSGAYSTSIRFGAAPARDAAAATAAADLIKETTTASFAADVIQESRKQPVLVDFWAPWCGPCRQLAPALEKVVREQAGKVKLVKMNIDEHPSIAGQLGIQSIPAVIAFKDGKPFDGFMGAVAESQIREFIGRLGGAADAAAEIEAAIAQAVEARAAGDAEGAADVYSAVLAHDPDHIEARAGLADLLLEAGEVEKAAQTLAAIPEAKAGHAEIAAVKARIALARQTASFGDPGELERRLAANPKDYQARFDLAIVQNGRGLREEAADSLLAIYRADREWNDGAARKQLLQFFDAWGAIDPVTLAARRKLSSLMFA